MIPGISSDYDSYTSSVSAVSGNISTAKVSDSDDEKEAEGSQVPKTDTIEISQQARAAMRQSVVAAANSDSSVSAQTQQNDAELLDSQNDADASQVQGKGSAAGKPAATASSTKESTSTSDNENVVLSTLTEQQMDDLVSEGTITKAQESKELTRRETAKASGQVQTEQEDGTSAQSVNKSYEYGIEMYKAQAQSITGSGISSFFNSVA